METWLEEKRQEPKVGQMLVLLGVHRSEGGSWAGLCRDPLRRENTQFPALTLIHVSQINRYDTANPAWVS